MKKYNMTIRILHVWLLGFTLSFGLLQSTAFADFLRLNPPPDVDKDFLEGNYSCWLATAANMLAAADYGNGNTMQARAEDIYGDMIDQYGTNLSGNPKTAIDWWLNYSDKNVWPSNPYDKCDQHLTSYDMLAPQRIGNWLRAWNFVGLCINKKDA